MSGAAGQGMIAGPRDRLAGPDGRKRAEHEGEDCHRPVRERDKGAIVELRRPWLLQVGG